MVKSFFEIKISSIERGKKGRMEGWAGRRNLIEAQLDEVTHGRVDHMVFN